MANRILKLKPERQELPRLECRERLTIGGHQIKGADRPGVIFDDPAFNQELPESIPGGFRGGAFTLYANNLLFARQRPQIPTFSFVAKDPYAHQHRNLCHYTGKEDKRQISGTHHNCPVLSGSCQLLLLIEHSA
jgi:hypothetical protein